MAAKPRACYRLTKERFGWPVGTIVYDSPNGSYGLVSEDDRRTGIRHRFVTIDRVPVNRAGLPLVEQCGDGFPHFTCPIADLELIEEMPPQIS
jgi:hypothetical protein